MTFSSVGQHVPGYALPLWQLFFCERCIRLGWFGIFLFLVRVILTFRVCCFEAVTHVAVTVCDTFLSIIVFLALDLWTGEKQYVFFLPLQAGLMYQLVICTRFVTVLGILPGFCLEVLSYVQTKIICGCVQEKTPGIGSCWGTKTSLLSLGKSVTFG